MPQAGVSIRVQHTKCRHEVDHPMVVIGSCPGRNEDTESLRRFAPQWHLAECPMLARRVGVRRKFRDQPPFPIQNGYFEVPRGNKTVTIADFQKFGVIVLVWRRLLRAQTRMIRLGHSRKNRDPFAGKGGWRLRSQVTNTPHQAQRPAQSDASEEVEDDELEFAREPRTGRQQISQGLKLHFMAKAQ